MFMLTENFSRDEMACRCGCNSCDMNYRFLYILEKIRKEYGRPMRVNSGYRCRAHNLSVKGSVNSKHLDGMAADIACSNSKARYEIITLAQIMGITGIGVGKDFLHLDVRSEPSCWVY